MGVIEGNGGGIGIEGGLLGVEDTLDILVELVGWIGVSTRSKQQG